MYMNIFVLLSIIAYLNVHNVHTFSPYSIKRELMTNGNKTKGKENFYELDRYSFVGLLLPILGLMI